MNPPDGKRLVISEEDLAPTAATSQPPAASGPSTGPSLSNRPVGEPASAELPRVYGLGAAPLDVGRVPSTLPSAAASSFIGSVRGRNLTAASVGILVGWAVCEITGIGLWSSSSSFGQDVASGVYTGSVGFFFAVTYAAWEHVVARNWAGIRRWLGVSGPLGFGLAFVAGFIAQIVFRHFVIQIARSLTLSDLLHLQSNIKLYLTRALAWGLFGLGMGVAVAGVRARQKLVNGAVGGAIGGAIGGLVFHWASFNVSSQSTARLVGLLCVGAAVGLAIGIVETLRRDAWLNIASGPMAGKEFIVYNADFSLGSSPQCDVTLIKDGSLASVHAVIRTTEVAGQQPRVLYANDGCAVFVNTVPVVQPRHLRGGDVIALGASTIVYSERRSA